MAIVGCLTWPQSAAKGRPSYADFKSALGRLAAAGRPRRWTPELAQSAKRLPPRLNKEGVIFKARLRDPHLRFAQVRLGNHEICDARLTDFENVV
jgi:hypothetical protein